jgi:hypothetical protein
MEPTGDRRTKRHGEEPVRPGGTIAKTARAAALFCPCRKILHFWFWLKRGRIFRKPRKTAGLGLQGTTYQNISGAQDHLNRVGVGKFYGVSEILTLFAPFFGPENDEVTDL